MKLARARQFVEAVVAHDLDAAQKLLDADVETVTPRGTLRGIAACKQVLQRRAETSNSPWNKQSPSSRKIDGDVIARTHEVARWRESGEMAYERDFAVRLTLDDERIVRIVVMPGVDPRSRVESGSQAD